MLAAGKGIAKCNSNGKEEKLAGKKTKANLQVKRNKKNKPKEIKIKQIKRDKTK